MFSINSTDISCGVHQLSNLYDYGKTSLRAFAKGCLRPTRRQNTSAIYAFSDSVDNGNGRAFAAIIEKHNLGELVKIGPIQNPNSGNNIEAWYWIPDTDAIHLYLNPVPVVNVRAAVRKIATKRKPAAKRS